MVPRVFISYSWSSPGHQARIREWAEQLRSDGVDVVLDVWDLNEGDDKNAFMERMVTDKTVTHVLVFCDSEYAAKADNRRAGVGTESQIISQEVYGKVKQSKFIPVVCEVDDDGEPCLPTFLKSRIWIDYSSSEAANQNWEQLVRALYGKPIHEKPSLGKAPSYVHSDSTVPASPAAAKFAALRQAVLQDKRGRKLYRQDFLNACCTYADQLRVRERPDVNALGERVLEDCGKLKLVRDHVVDWVLLESEIDPSEEFGDELMAMLERLLELKERPPKANLWNNAWSEAHSIFVYETFLYIVAALMKTGAFNVLHEILTSHYLLQKTAGGGPVTFDTIQAFYGSSTALQILAPEGRRLLAPAAELIKRQADRADLPFEAVKEAELLVLMMVSINPKARWYPQTLLYSSRGGGLRFFVRAAQHRNFLKLAAVTGIPEADSLREKVREGFERLGVQQWEWGDFRKTISFWEALNMDALDTLK